MALLLLFGIGNGSFQDMPEASAARLITRNREVVVVQWHCNGEARTGPGISNQAATECLDAFPHSTQAVAFHHVTAATIIGDR
jgi:hypothetical protein